MTVLLSVAAAVFIINLPFGYWRAGVRKFSPAWFLAVHLPVPAVIAVRILSGLGFSSKTLPLMVVSYFAGQWLGGSLRTRRKPAP